MDGSPKSFDGVFINTDEKHAKDQQLHQLLRTAQVARKKAELNSEIISAVSHLYDSIYQIDLTKNLYQEISSGSGERVIKEVPKKSFGKSVRLWCKKKTSQQCENSLI